MVLARFRLCCVGLLFTLSACADADDFGQSDDFNDLDEMEIGFRTVNGGRSDNNGGSRGGGGDWLGNGLIDPSVSGVNVNHGLSTAQGLNDSEGWLDVGDTDGLDAIRHLVECALDDTQTIWKTVDGQLTPFPGRVGFAPEWSQGSCDEDCQEWVSACMLARTNPVGVTRNIWIEAAHPAVGFGAHPDFPHFEATYYGNLFDPTQVKNSCQGDANGQSLAQTLDRTCSITETACGFASNGDCMLDAECDVTAEGLILSCQTDPTGPSYHTITVHIGPGSTMPPPS